MFELTKPITSCGIGFDHLPVDFVKSEVFTKNHLARLAGIEEIPDETEVNEYKLIELSDLFVSLDKQPKELELALHNRAKNLLEENKLKDAWLTLLSFNNG
jgi:hypothetical protein